MSISPTYTKGHIVLTMALALLFVVALSFLIDARPGGSTLSAQATSTATTTVTVLNTPPAWTVTARESVASATSTPTNSGDTVTWTAVGTDSNGEDYYLLICKSSSTPTPSAGPPVCGGGTTDIWAVSTSTLSGSVASVSTTTAESWAETNAWYGYICDNNPGSAECNPTMYNGLHEGGASATSSPFMVNHRPTITTVADDSPQLPGDIVTWTSTAGDTDIAGGDDTVQLHVCQTAGFDAGIPACTGTQWATSTFIADNPSATTSIPVPYQDGDHDAFVYLIDEHGHVSVSAWQGSSTVLTVANAAPYVASSSIQLYDVFGSTTIDTTLALTEPEGETQNYVVVFDVTDENGCQNLSAGNEVTDVDINVFRSGAGGPTGLLCDASGEYNANYCYTHTNSFWTPVCVQTAASCTASDWNNITWECTFPLWYIADPTDVGSEYPGEDWRASARATDDDASTGNYSTEDEAADAGAEMTQFLSFRATGSPIAYGSFQPGFGNAEHPGTTTVFATGNTGLDHYLSGDEMCTTYPTCTGNATSTIYVPYQHYSTTSSHAYGFDLGNQTFELATSSSPVLVDVDILKTTSTSSPSEDDTYWGILVPGSIALAGDYIGRNYIDAAIAPSSAW